MKILSVVLLFSLIACHRAEQPQDKVRVAAIAMNAPPVSASYERVEIANETAVDGNEYAGDRIMKTANLRFQVDSVENSTRNIEAITLRYNGIVADQSISNATNEINNTISIRVPVSSFEKFIEDVCKEAVFINYKKTTSQNVTEEYQDIQARLKTKREVRDRYTDILKTKAKTVEDILKAEEHIRMLQEEIESREGRLRFLQTRTAMSEIDLHIYQKVIFTEAPTLVEKTFSTKITDALHAGWSFVMACALFVISCWPLFIPCVAIFLAWRKFKRRVNSEESLKTSME